MNDFLSQLVAHALTPHASIMPRIPSRFEPLTTGELPVSAAETSAFAQTQPTVPAAAMRSLPQAAREAIRPAKASGALMSDPPPLTDVSPSGEHADDDLGPAPGLPPIRPATVQAIEPSIAFEKPLTDRTQMRGTPGQRSPIAALTSVSSALPLQTVHAEIKPVARGTVTGVVSSRVNAADDSSGALPKATPAAAGDFTVPGHVAPQSPNEQAAFRENDGAHRFTRPRVLEIHPAKAPLPASGGMSGTSADQRAVLAPVPPTVQVMIGRVEVRSVVPSPPTARNEVPRIPHLSLDDYLKPRNGGRR
jgi:hypothetical protein